MLAGGGVRDRHRGQDLVGGVAGCPDEVDLVLGFAGDEADTAVRERPETHDRGERVVRDGGVDGGRPLGGIGDGHVDLRGGEEGTVILKVGILVRAADPVGRLQREGAGVHADRGEGVVVELEIVPATLPGNDRGVRRGEPDPLDAVLGDHLGVLNGGDAVGAVHDDTRVAREGDVDIAVFVGHRLAKNKGRAIGEDEGRLGAARPDVDRSGLIDHDGSGKAVHSREPDGAAAVLARVRDDDLALAGDGAVEAES